jgi:hypothetical protein
MPGFVRYERENLGFRTVNLDGNAIVDSLHDYLSLRINHERAVDIFHDFLNSQDDDIKGNWLMVSILTSMFLDPTVDFKVPIIYHNGRIGKDEDGDLVFYDLDSPPKISRQEIMYEGVRMLVWNHALERDPNLFIAPIKNDEISDSDYNSHVVSLLRNAKQEYLGDVMPTISLICSYMTINDRPVVPYDEMRLIMNDRWNPLTELLYRKGERDSRFITDVEHKEGLTASTLAYLVRRENAKNR